MEGSSVADLNGEYTSQILSGVRFAPLQVKPAVTTVLPSNVWSLSMQRGYPSGHEICFAKEHLHAIMGGVYSCPYTLAHNQVTAYYDNVTEAMKKAKDTPDASQLYWGNPQVIPLKFKCTGTPKITQVLYPTHECVEHKGKTHTQFNSHYYCRVMLAEQHSSSMSTSTADCQVVDLFDLLSSQGSNNTSPCLCRDKKRAHNDFVHGNAVDGEGNSNEDDGVYVGLRLIVRS